MNSKKVLVGMSGGIDSSSVCLMLQEQGYEIVGVTMRAWDNGSDYIDEAKALAVRLGIDHYVVDIREEFRNTVVQNFIDEYLNGRTPNPCVMCNPMFKFRILAEYADHYDCVWIATGHYSKILNLNGHYYIECGEDIRKDQSYFLWRLEESVLKRCIFPLGGMTKVQVREYLRQKGFEAKASSGESMEVCFIKGDYRDFLREQVPDIDSRIKEGLFVSTEGKKLGTHKGFPYYTIGQRKGLGIALGEPAFVVRINTDKNTVMLGSRDKLIARYMLVENYKFIDEEDFFSGNHSLSVRIRYKSAPIPCRVSKIDGNMLIVEFLSEASSITPGQSAVFYDGKLMLGGGYIASQRMLGLYLSDEYKSLLDFK